MIKISGSATTARRITDGREVQRDASQFKLANVLMYQENVDESGQSEDWRETLLMGGGDIKDQPIYEKDSGRSSKMTPSCIWPITHWFVSLLVLFRVYYPVQIILTKSG